VGLREKNNIRSPRGSRIRTVMRIAGSGLALSLLALVPFQTPFGSESPLTPVAAGKSASKGRANAPPLRFGIYPGGSMGSVNQTREPLPEDPAKSLAAVRGLSQGLPFVVHLYRSYYGGGRTQARDSGLDGEIREYTDAGIKVELVARYRPNSGSAGAVTGFKKYVRALVARYGSNPDFIGLQVTNEANLRAAPDASDGAYAGAKKALVRGVLAAARETRVRDASQIKIGFNWAWESDRKKRRRFWEGLGRRTGSKFRKAVDWIGVNSYPGTWAPAPGQRRAPSPAGLQDPELPHSSLAEKFDAPGRARTPNPAPHLRERLADRPRTVGIGPGQNPQGDGAFGRSGPSETEHQ
jgi:hypothetical protein